MVGRIIYVNGFKIGDNEACSQRCLISLISSGFTGDKKYILYSEYEEIQLENRKLLRWHRCGYIHIDTLDNSGICNKCGWVESYNV